MTATEEEHLADCLKNRYKASLDERELDDNLEQLCWLHFKRTGERISKEDLIIQLILEDDPTGKFDEGVGK